MREIIKTRKSKKEKRNIQVTLNFTEKEYLKLLKKMPVGTIPTRYFRQLLTGDIKK